MNALQLLLAQPWVERLGWTLVHFLWQGALIAFLFALARALAGRAQVRYALACAALVAMLAAPVLTFSLTGVWNSPPPPQLAGASAAPSTAVGYAAAVTTWDTAWRLPALNLWRKSLPWMVVIWMAGAIAFSMRLIGGWAITARLRSVATRPAPREWQETLNGLMARIGISRPVRLLISPLVEVPAVIGWLRPVVLVPLGSLTGLPQEHVEALLAHELAHILRQDYLANLLQSVAEALLFYHPAVWWISRQIRSERELCCDDLAVTVNGCPLTYARALAELESCRPAHMHAAVAANGGSLRNRIGRLLGQPPTPSHMLPASAAALAAGVLLLAGIGAVALHGAQEPVSQGNEPVSQGNEPAEAPIDGRGVTVDLGGAAVMHRTWVEYPGPLMDRGIQGTVSVEVTLDAGGQVSDAHVLSGPVELRGVVLRSVLQWHFMSGAPGATRQVSVNFQIPAGFTAPVEPRKENRGPFVFVDRANGLTYGQARTVTTQQGTVTIQEAPAGLSASTDAEQGRTVVREPNGEPSAAEREQRLREPISYTRDSASYAREHASGEPVGNEVGPINPRVQERRFLFSPETTTAGRILKSIEVRGMTDEAGNLLLARLPLREGDTIPANGWETIRRAVMQFDEHLESSFEPREDGVVLRIHPAGSAREPLIHRQ